MKSATFPPVGIVLPPDTLHLIPFCLSGSGSLKCMGHIHSF